MQQQNLITESSDRRLPWEGAFIPKELGRLRLSLGRNVVRSYAFLSRQIQRWPKHLVFHVCRIECAMCMDEEDAIDAAVLDLFYVLEDKGQNLRQSILDKIGHKMSGEMLSSLKQALHNHNPLQILPFTSRSVLHDGQCEGEMDLLILITDDKENSDVLDPVNTARACLESGQIEQAQEILEAQLKIEPERVEIRTDLLEIYCATRDEVSFMTSYQLLQLRGCLDDSWETAVNFFSNSQLKQRR